MISKDAALALREIAGPLLVLDEDGLVVHVNESLSRLLGLPATALTGGAFVRYVREGAPHLQSLLRKFGGSGEWMVGFVTLCGAEGVTVDFPCQGKVLQRPRGGQRKLVVVKHHVQAGFTAMTHRLRDVQTETRRRHDAEYLLRLSRFALDHAGDSMFWVDQDARIVMVNERTCRDLGYSREELLGMRIPDIDPECTEELWAEHWQALKQAHRLVFERINRRKDGSTFPVEVSATYLCFQGREFDFAVTRDVSERKMAEQTINELAFFDRLTGLPNRTLLLDRLKQAMTAAHRNGLSCAVLLIDLDNFKTLNDVHGHDTGDQLLKQVALRLNACVREGDSIARFGGDEFIAVVTNLAADAGEAAADSEGIAQKMLDSLTHPYNLGKLIHHTSASIGVTLFHGERTGIDDLLKQAELAMYKSKDAGRNAIRFFDPTLESTVQERAALENDLRQAFAERQFQLHYQPQIAEGRLTGAEALVRWQHPQRGLISPVEFIPLAEETGLILPLGNWVLETACRQLSTWAGHPQMDHLTIAVNVSAHQFCQPDFVDQVLATLAGSGTNPQRLKLELTESLLVQNVDEVIEKMFALKAKGVGFSLDDFGTGYSSLAYLKRLPLDQLKIDRSFVRDVLTDPNDASIARTIIALAQNLGLGVIAEGVETEAQREFLAGSGCHAYQGYLFAKPLPIAGFEAYAQSA